MEGGSEKDNPFVQVKGKKDWFQRGRGNRGRGNQRGRSQYSRGTATQQGGYRVPPPKGASASGVGTHNPPRSLAAETVANRIARNPNPGSSGIGHLPNRGATACANRGNISGKTPEVEAKQDYYYKMAQLEKW